MSENKVEQRLYEKYGRELLSKKEVQDELGIGESTLDKMRRNEEIGFVTISGKIKFSLADVADVILGEKQ